MRGFIYFVGAAAAPLLLTSFWRGAQLVLMKANESRLWKPNWNVKGPKRKYDYWSTLQQKMLNGGRLWMGASVYYAQPKSQSAAIYVVSKTSRVAFIDSRLVFYLRPLTACFAFSVQLMNELGFFFGRTADSSGRDKSSQVTRNLVMCQHFWINSVGGVAWWKWPDKLASWFSFFHCNTRPTKS